MQFLRKKPLTVMMIITSTTLLLVFLIYSSFASTISSLHNNIVYAENSNNTTGLSSTTNLTVNGKTIPVKYNITAAAGKLLGLVEDKDKTTLLAIISSPSDKGTLTIEVPRNIVDDKKEGNADDKFIVHIDGKDATVREISNNKTTRTLAIDFNKDARLIEILSQARSCHSSLILVVIRYIGQYLKTENCSDFIAETFKTW